MFETEAAAIEELSPQDRLELETYLRARNLASSREYAVKLDQIMSNVREGQSLSSGDVRDLHQTMKSKGL